MLAQNAPGRLRLPGRRRRRRCHDNRRWSGRMGRPAGERSDGAPARCTTWRSRRPPRIHNPPKPPKPIVLAQSQVRAPAAAGPVSAPGEVSPNPSPEDAARLLAEQQQPRQVAPFDPPPISIATSAITSLAPTAMFHITRDGAKFLTQLTGQQPVQVYPESETKFFATVVPAQISFAVDAQGVVTGLVLHQNGREQPAPRIDDAKGKTFEAALAQRIRINSPSSGTEAFLRRYLESQEAGAPDYSAMAPGLAQARARATGPPDQRHQGLGHPAVDPVQRCHAARPGPVYRHLQERRVPCRRGAYRPGRESRRLAVDAAGGKAGIDPPRSPRACRAIARAPEQRRIFVSISSLPLMGSQIIAG